MRRTINKLSLTLEWVFYRRPRPGRGEFESLTGSVKSFQGNTSVISLNIEVFKGK